MKNITREKEIPTNLGPWANKGPLGTSHSTTETLVKSYWIPNGMNIFLERSQISKASQARAFTGRARISYVNGRREEWNPCHHSVIEYCSLPYAKIWSQATRSRWYAAPYFRDRDSGTVTERLSRHLTDDYQNARLRAWLVMQPRFEGEISLLNFLWELQDVSRLISHAYAILRKMKKLIKRRPRKAKNDPTVETSAAILEWNLAIMPLLADVTAIWSQLFEKVKEAEALFASAGQEPQTSYYSEILEDRSTYSYGTGNDYYHEYGTHYYTKFTAAMMYGYSYNMRSSHKAFLKYWGLEGSWQALYNAFPFSFIVDYFANVGDAIRYMERDRNVDTHVMKYSETLKTTMSNGTHINSRSTYGYNYTIINGIEHATGLTTGYRSTLYSRRITRPLTTGFYVPIVKEPNDKQKLNLLCLARQAFR